MSLSRRRLTDHDFADGLDPIEGNFLIQGLRSKQTPLGTSSRFQLLLERKLQAELAAKAQQELSVQQQIEAQTQGSGVPHCPPSFDLSQQASANQDPFGPDFQNQVLQSSLLGQMGNDLASSNFSMSGQMAAPQNGDLRPPSQNGNSSSLSNYHAMPPPNTYASSSNVPSHLVPQAVAPSYQPAPFRSQHYQRLLAAKLANSEQSGLDAASGLANDAAASFMQHWTDHTLDPNYPTPQELSFLPSTHSPLYQLFNSGYGQEHYQSSQSYPDSTMRHTSSSQSLSSHTANDSRFDGQGGSNARAMWPVNHLQQTGAITPSASAPPFYPTLEPSQKYAPWMNSYGQQVDESDATSTQSSRAPGLSITQQSEGVLSHSSRSPLPKFPDQLASSAREPSVLETKNMGNAVSSSPQQLAGEVNETGEDGEPKKAVLACHFCRGRKLKCDGTRPTCSHCDKRGLTCSYDAQIRRRGPGKRKREQMAMLAAAEGQVDEDGTPLLHKLLAPKPKGKRGRKPKNRNPEGEVVDAPKPASDQPVKPKGEILDETLYARPPNPYLPSYFIPEQTSDAPMLGPGLSQHAGPSPQPQLAQPPHLGPSHQLDTAFQHRMPPQAHPYHSAYQAQTSWLSEMDHANKRQRTEQYPVGGRW
ncbi:hypothetical protein NCC49_001374 [Naganishia albida]|nr:hypothetical protein NCC49_001374 [Naganishia albida]